VLLLAESPGRRQTLADFLAEYGMLPAAGEDFAGFLAAPEHFMLGIGPLSGGFVLDDLAVITENELYAATARPRNGRRSDARRANLDGWLRDLSELKIGDPVVHENHGIGRYLGLAHMDFGDGATELLHLEYANGAKLYVPVAALQVISRYSGADPESVQLHIRSAPASGKRRRRKPPSRCTTPPPSCCTCTPSVPRAKATRSNSSNTTWKPSPTASASRKPPTSRPRSMRWSSDMKSGKPMDRLVCGDVGFGKTEVAMRAAFVAVADGKQVAMLCPTTLLAEQHYQNFSDRFADWPVKVAELSRFKSAKEQTRPMQKRPRARSTS
jgi:transcription-repair coupling factor (superfamily II helicase)